MAVACGISVGALAFLVARTPLHAVYAASGGIVLGNIAYGFINFYAYGAPVFSLGQSWIYNAFFIAIAVVLSACELSVALSHAAANASATRRSLRFEAGEDRNFDDVSGDDEIFQIIVCFRTVWGIKTTRVFHGFSVRIGRAVYLSFVKTPPTFSLDFDNASRYFASRLPIRLIFSQKSGTMYICNGVSASSDAPTVSFAKR